MRIKNIFLPTIAASLLLVGCDDEKMEWYTPEGHGAVASSEIPLQLAEKIANYDYIKNYAQQYLPGGQIGLGISADKYTEGLGNYDSAYAAVANQNFQIFTPGNAMKHQSVVQANGSLNLSTVTPFIQQANDAGIEVFGHNFIWHTQQQQTYLKSLIAPEVTVIPDAQDVCKNVIANSDFESGDNGWSSWSNHVRTVVSPGYDSDHCLELAVSASSANQWSDQLFYTFDKVLVPGTTYAYQFWAKSNVAGAKLQFLGQSSDYSQQIYGANNELTTNWVQYTGEFTLDDDKDAIIRVGAQFGGMEATIYIDDFKFGEKISGPTNYCPNGSFENGFDQWTCNNPSAGAEAIEMDGAIDGKHVLKVTSTAESSNYWDAQLTTPTMATWPGEKVRISFYIKSDQPGQARVSYPSGSEISNQWPWVNWTGKQSSWTESFETSSNWLEINYVMQNMSHDFVEGASTWRFCIDLGKLPGVTYYIDDVRVTLLSEEEPDAAQARRKAGIQYTFKSAEEKREALLGAMKEWIDGMAAACPTVKQWDVVNEPIADGNHKWRGFDGTFGMDGDSEPVENSEEGLNLNWANESGNAHFYWGYFIGRDYAAKAFQYAREAIGAGAKLYVNEYGLESSPGKTQALIDFVKYIDENGGKVDGIGTQMHLTISTSDADKIDENLAALKTNVDAMFKSLAATGKLVRVSELDIAFGTTNGEEVSPSATQYAAQSDAYQIVMDSYKANVPEAQRGGFCIWTLSDKKDEHEYWLKGDKPNLFDKNYARKHAYKGLCDGIAGKDISSEFSGEDWKKVQ